MFLVEKNDIMEAELKLQGKTFSKDIFNLVIKLQVRVATKHHPSFYHIVIPIMRSQS